MSGSTQQAGTRKPPTNNLAMHNMFERVAGILMDKEKVQIKL